MIAPFLSLYLFLMQWCVYCSGSRDRASQPGCFSLSRSGNLVILSAGWSFLLMPPHQTDLFSLSPTVSTGDDAGTDPAAAHEGYRCPVSSQAMVPSPSIDDLWHRAFESYGLKRPPEVTEIHVFRVILQSSRDKNACTRSVTQAGPMSDPFQTLEQIIEEWWDLEIEENDQSWMLTAVNRACTRSPNKDLSYPAYVLTRKGNPFHLLRPHGVFEVLWGHRQWVNNYHCLGLFTHVCGPMLASSCAMWCDDIRLSEELIECHIGSFVQVHIETLFSDLVRIDLQASLQRSIHTLHLPGKAHDDLVKMKIFVPQGVTCFSGTTFDCTSPFENWQAVLMAEGRRAYPGRNPDTMIFHRVHKAIEEVSPIFDPATKHFILADSDEQERTRTVVFAVFTSRFEFFGACHWTPVTQVWDILDLCGGEKGWVIYHNNQRLRHHKVSVHQGDFFACYERGDSAAPFQADRPVTDVAQGWVANAPMLVSSEAAGSATLVPSVGDATGSARNDASPTFENTGDPFTPHRKREWSPPPR